MNEIYNPLFTPWKIKNVEIKNRIVMTSMGGTSIFGWMEPNHFDKEAAHFLLERAQNNVGLILPGIAPIRNPMLGQWLYQNKGMYRQLKKFMVAFGLNSGAYVSEILRGGILAVPQGQREAGLSLGLSYRSVMEKIILPQAFKNAFPALGNELVTLLKETSVAGFIGTLDLTLAFRKIANATYDFVTVYLVMDAFVRHPHHFDALFLGEFKLARRPRQSRVWNPARQFAIPIGGKGQ